MNKSSIDPELFEAIQKKIDRLAGRMDDFIKIPGTNIGLGWDSILGWLPGIGDVFTLLSQAYLIFQAFRVGVRKRVFGKMLLNALIDFLVGAIPGLGDLFDIFWRSNRRNANLIRDEIARITKSDASDVT
jgi:hypothetical protein